MTLIMKRLIMNMMQKKNIEKKILDDKKLLEKTNIVRNSRKQILKNIIDEAKYVVFGFLFPSEDNEKSKTTDEQREIIDMSEL